MRSIGLDIHRDFCEVAIAEEGRVRAAGRIGTAPAEIEAFAGGLRPDGLPDGLPDGSFVGIGGRRFGYGRPLSRSVRPNMAAFQAAIADELSRLARRSPEELATSGGRPAGSRDSCPRSGVQPSRYSAESPPQPAPGSATEATSAPGDRSPGTVVRPIVGGPITQISSAASVPRYSARCGTELRYTNESPGPRTNMESPTYTCTVPEIT